jgi:hypothetical protein
MSDTLFLSEEVCFELAFCASKTKIRLEICKLKSTCHPVSQKTLYIYVWYGSLTKYKHITKFQKIKWRQDSISPPELVFNL